MPYGDFLMLLGTDYKYADAVETGLTIDYSGHVEDLYKNLVRGDTATNNFDGSSVYPKYLQVNYQLVSAAAAQGGYNTMRVIIGQSAVPGIPTPDDILTGGGSVSAPLSVRRFQNVKNYKVLYDKLFTLNAYVNYAISEKVFIPGKRLRPLETTTAGALSFTKGDLWMLVISDDGVTTYPQMSYYSRVMFSD